MISSLESRVLGNLASTVRRGADGKGRSRLPVTADALRAYELRRKPYLASRLPYTLDVEGEVAEAGANQRSEVA